MPSGRLYHSPVVLRYPYGWAFYAAHRSAKRLVIFVHGFGGHATKTWRNFQTSGQRDEWWRSSDMLFVGYESRRENIRAVAYRLRSNIDHFYPRPNPAALEFDGHKPRQDISTPYTELILLGHSLGGLIIRRAIVDEIKEWYGQHSAERAAENMPSLVDARVRLFSPASAGYRSGGLLGMVEATSIWFAVEAWLRKSSAYTDLQRGSPIIKETRKRTEHLHRKTGIASLTAEILWANPDNVVRCESYSTDLNEHFLDGTSHTSVCKPNETRQDPWQFARTGSIRQ